MITHTAIYGYVHDGGVHHTPLGRFSCSIDIATVGIVPVPKRSASETYRGEPGISFGIGTLLVVEQSSWDNRPRRRVSYTVRRRVHIPGIRIYIIYYILQVYNIYTYIVYT